MAHLCIERLPFSHGPSKNQPALAMDAALPSNGNGKLIEALLQFAAKLNPSDKAALESLIESHTDPTAAASDKTARDRLDPENVEAAVDLLRSKGLDGDTIAQFYKICGVEPGQAQDAARRSYASRFPDAARIGGDAKIQLATDPTKSYSERFPEAARIRAL